MKVLLIIACVALCIAVPPIGILVGFYVLDFVGGAES